MKKWSSVSLLSALLTFLVCLAGVAVADEVPEVALRAVEGIRADAVVSHARILSSPEYRGRMAGSRGGRRASEYICEMFSSMGLAPGGPGGSYWQVFQIGADQRLAVSLRLSVGGDEVGDLHEGHDYAPLRLADGLTSISGEIALAGYGITTEGFDEYAEIDVKGKAVLLFSGTPRSSSETWRALPGLEAFATPSYKAANAAKHGAICVLLVENPIGWRQSVEAPEWLLASDVFEMRDASVPVVQVRRGVAAGLLGLSEDELRLLALDIARQKEPQSIPLRGRLFNLRTQLTGAARAGRNIVGVLPGCDRRLRREAIVIGAHYDHLGEGMGEVLFGANDNAAGVGAMLEVAGAAVRARRAMRRTLVFVAFDAEEIGKCGSHYYVAHPTVPISRTSLMVNFDMIGRNEPDAIYVVGTRSSPELHAFHQRHGATVGLRLLHPESFRLGRSDHSPFYYARVPIAYFFGGLHEGYNTSQDTWDKLIPGKLEKVARLVFLTVCETAHRDKALTFVDAAGYGMDGGY